MTYGKLLRFTVFLLYVLQPFQEVVAQYNDGPIQLRVRVREVQTLFDATDEALLGVGFSPDELTYYVWARDAPDIDGVGWQGGNCLQDDFAPSAAGTSSADFNYEMFNNTYPAATVPDAFDIRLDAWEDDLPSDGLLGFCNSGSRCTHQGQQCCGVVVFGACVGIRTGDDERCDANPFQTAIDYRLGPPCSWYDHGFVRARAGLPGNCNQYRPHIESYWRYTDGTACGNAIDLGTLNAGGSLTHFNSNECYGNTYAATAGNDVYYQFTTTGAIGVRVSLCGAPGATLSNSYITLLDVNCNTVLVDNDDFCGQLSQASDNLCIAGTYYVVVSGAAAADVGTFILTVEEDPSFSFTASIAKNDISCFGANDGNAKANISGGTAPYTYLWTTGSPNDSIFGLAPGNYTVTVTDDDGCQVIESVTIVEPTLLTVVVDSTDVSCGGATDGIATATVSGGTPGILPPPNDYQYLWSTIPPQSQQSAVFLPAGTYTVTVTDANGCTTTGSTTVITPVTVIATLQSLNDVSCFGANDGSIDINVSGGVTPYSFDWSNGATTEDITGLGPGTYEVTITDGINCILVESYIITEPDTLIATAVDSFDVICNGGSNGAVDIEVQGGTLPYTALWSNTATSIDLFNVTAGTYTLTITDANGCQDIVTNTIEEPTAITIAFAPTDVSCFGGADGAIDATPGGGTPPYTYLWSNGATTEDVAALPAGTYGLLVTDFNNCFFFDFVTINEPTEILATSTVTNADCNLANTGSITLVVSNGTPGYTYTWTGGLPPDSVQNNLGAGTYTVTIEDQNNCQVVITETVSEPVALVANVASSQDVSCFGGTDGSVDVQQQGGTAPFTYFWDNGATTQDLFNVPSGTYNLVITDANNCQFTLNSVVVSEPAPIATTMASTDPSCFGVSNGTAGVTAIGGTPPYTYAWSIGVSTSTVSNLPAGTYTVIVTDDLGCVAFDTVTLQTGPLLILDGLVTDVTCGGGNDGEIAISVTGGTPAFTYNWSNGGNSGTLSGISGGNYSVTVVDQDGCQDSISFTVDEPDVLTVVVNTTDILCAGDDNGLATPSISGGTIPYTYAWSDGQTTDVATGLVAGQIDLTVTDDNGCTAENSGTVNAPQPLVVTVDNVDTVTCAEGEDGGVLLSATGGVQPYQFSVENNVFQIGSGSFSGLDAGLYTGLVLDDNGCIAVQNFDIPDGNAFEVSFAEPVVLTSLAAPVRLTPDLNGITQADVAQYDWNPADGLDCSDCPSAVATPATSTPYTVTVFDQNGCNDTATVTVLVQTRYQVHVPTAFTPNGDDLNNVWLPLEFGATETATVRVFNRWGSKVFETQDITQGWDGNFKGEPCPPDTYVYYIDGTYLNGESFSEYGSLTLLR